MTKTGVLAAIFLAALPSFGFAGTLPQIAVGQGGSYLIKSDGTFWAWGDYNAGKSYGAPDDDGKNTHPVPAQVDGLADAASVSVGAGHTVVLKKDGTVWAWGYNGEGQLGNGAIADGHFPAPVQVSALSGIKAVAAGERHCLAVKDDGTVWAWGNNWHGQLGDGTKVNRPSRTQVSGLSDVTAVAGGLGHSLAVKGDGTVWAWGYNDDGELGDGTKKARFTPAPVPGLAGVKAVAAGNHHSVALKSDGTVWVWGGTKETGQSTAPRRLQGLSDITAISAGGWYSLALKQDGTVWAWGTIANGEEGDDTMNEVIKKPVQLRGLANVTGIAAGMWHSLAIVKDRTVWAWGRNYHGALGDGTGEGRPLPVRSLAHD